MEKKMDGNNNISEELASAPSFDPVTTDTGELIGYETVEKSGAFVITTTYDTDFQKTGTTVEKEYDAVELDQMSDAFQSAWASVSGDLPGAFNAGVHFASEGGHTLIIAKADYGDSVSNGDIIGRISEWENTGTWTRWLNDEEVDVRSEEWSYNFHDADWNNIASAGGRNVFLTNLTDENGEPLEDELDEVGERVASTVHKDMVDVDSWAAQQTGATSDSVLEILETTWDAIKYIEVQDDTWRAVENSYRSADELWDDGVERIQLHGIKNDPDNTEFIGSVSIRDGFIIVRDEYWNELARLIDPSSASEDTTYAAMQDKFGDAFGEAWDALSDFAPSELANPEDLQYIADNDNDILIFSDAGAMVGRLHTWQHSDTWERSWDEDYPEETYNNSNFELQVINGDNGNWINVGRFETGSSELISASGAVETDRTWSQVSSTQYGPKDESVDQGWEDLGAEHLTEFIAEKLGLDNGWDDVGRIEISEQEDLYFPVAWRDEFETETSSQVRLYAEVPMNDGEWYRSQFLGSVEKRGGFIEIRDENWNTVERIADLSNSAEIKDWDFISDRYEGIEAAWDNVKAFFSSDDLKDPEALKFTFDDNNIYAFSAAGVMVGQINFWTNENEWERYYDDQILTVKNINYNYNFHDADWNNIANSGGNERYIVDPDDGSLMLDERGMNVGFRINKDDVSSERWAEYDPQVDAINFDDPDAENFVEEIRYETRSWESVTNDYRAENENWSDSNVQIQYFARPEGQNWLDDVGAMEIRDGFVEIYDRQWNTISKRVEVGLSYDEMVTKYGNDFVEAWSALADYLPDEFGDGRSLLYTTDKWDNILMFNGDTPVIKDTYEIKPGEMIGKINYWSHSDTWSRDWDDEYPSQVHSNKNFQFERIQEDPDGNNWQWVSVGRYETGTNELIDPDGNLHVESRWENVGSTMFERAMPDTWDDLASDYFSDAVADALGITWDAVQRIEVSDNTSTYEAIRWREEEETETSTQVRYYEEVSMNDGDWYHNRFLGSIEKRDGFIEIRDENWNVVQRVADITNSDAVIDWAAVTDQYAGLEEAWENVTTFLTDQDLKVPEGLLFTTDDNHIYAFNAAGVMKAQINFWNNEHEWTSYYDDEPYTVKNFNYNYNFHDADWNNLANSGGNERFIVDPDNDSLMLDEQGSHVGFNLRVEDADADTWASYDPGNVEIFGTDDRPVAWSDIAEIRYQTNSWSSVTNEFREEEENWSDSNTQTQFFATVEGQDWTRFVGAIEERDGFVEYRDENWNVIAKKVVGGDGYLEMVTKYGGDFADAWDALSEYLPTEFADPTSLTFTTDQWDNILVFAGDGAENAGEMIGQINYWSHIDTWDRDWDAEFPQEIHSNKNFHFQGIDEQDNGNWHWVSIGEYQTGKNELVDADGVPHDDRSWSNVGSTMYQKNMPDEWAGMEADYFLPIIEEKLGFDWSDVGRIEVSDQEHTYHAIENWRDEEDVEMSTQVRFYEEIPQEGGWSYSKFLGSMEARDGFIEIRDDDWETVARVVDGEGDTFADLAAANPHLAWAWGQALDYLPEEAQDVVYMQMEVEDPENGQVITDVRNLSFTSDEYNIYAFDPKGEMVLQINIWKWDEEHTSDVSGITYSESSYEYRFNDQHWNTYAEARKAEEYVSNVDNPEGQLDRVREDGSFRVRKADFEDNLDAWNAFDPEDDTETIIWDDVVEISIGFETWETVANFDRAQDNTYSGEREEREYFVEVEDRWGNTWPERVGTIETEGTLSRVYDSEWELVGVQAEIPEGDTQSLRATLDAMDTELLAQYEEILSQYGNIDNAQYIAGETADDPGIIVENGLIVASVRYEERWENNDTQLYWDYRLEDLDGENILSVGGWKEADEPGNSATLKDKPNGVFIRQYFYRDFEDPLDWNDLRSESEIVIDGFNWDDVGVVSKQIWKNDWNDEGYSTRVEYQFIKEDPFSGRRDWDYFRSEHEDGIIKIKDNDGNILGYNYPSDAQPESLSDAMGAGFETLIDAVINQLSMHYNTDAPMFMSGEFASLGGGAVTWSNEDDPSQTLVGELNFDEQPNEWGDRGFSIKFERPDGEPLIEFGGNVSVDGSGEPDYDYAEVRVREYIYKTDLETGEVNQSWLDALDLYGPTDSLVIPEEVWANVQMIELQTRYRAEDGELVGYGPEEMPPHLMPSEVSARFVQGEIDNTGDLNLDWTWDLDYRIELMGGAEALFQGDTLINATLARDSYAEPLADHYVFGDETGFGQMVLDFVNSEFGDILEAEIPGFGTASLLTEDGGALLVEPITEAILAFGEFDYDYEPDEWGNISFRVEFQSENGHPLIGFGGWSSVDEYDELNFENYSIRLKEYRYKSEMDPSDWAALEQQYGPTDDLPIPAEFWDEVQMARIQTEYRGGNNDPDATSLTPVFDETEVRFVKGSYDEQDDRLDLYWDWETDYNITLDDGFEILRQGNEEIASAIGRDTVLTDVVDFDTDFNQGFTNLIDVTGVFSSIFSDQSPFSFKVNDADVPDLFVFMADSFEGVMKNTTTAWQAMFDDVTAGYELYSNEGDYRGWLWESTQRDYTDLAGETHTGVTSYASNLVFGMYSDAFPPEAWDYIVDNFAIPVDAGYTYDDVSRIRIRQETVVDADGNIVNENIYLQHDLDGSNNVNRIGFDITKGMAYTFAQGEWPDPLSDDYTTIMSDVVANAVDVGTALTDSVKTKVNQLIDTVYSDAELPEDFYDADGATDPTDPTDPTDSEPPVDEGVDANVYLNTDAYSLMAAIMGYDEASEAGAVTEIVDVTGNGFVMSAGTIDGSVDLGLEITSTTIMDINTLLGDYFDSFEGTISFSDVAGNLDGFVTGALIDANAMGSNLSYTATLSSTGTEILSLDVDDIELTLPPEGEAPTEEPPTGEDMGPMFEIIADDPTMVDIFTHGFSSDVSGLDGVAAMLQQEDDTLSDQAALDAAIDDFIYAFLDDDPETPFVAGV